jgi:archaeosortase A (PGF-CTERM-specific)
MASSLLTATLAWLSVGGFVAGALAMYYHERAGRLLTATMWGVFGIFWGTLVPQFWFVGSSFIEAALALVAVPLCFYTGYLLLDGRDSLFVISRAVAVMGVIYLPATTIDAIYEPMIRTVTLQTQWAMNALGYHPELVANDNGLQSVFLFVRPNGHRILTEIELACTGLGSMAIFAGLITAVDAPLDRKAKAFLVSIPVIWGLNLVRNVFIAVAFGEQWFRVFVPQVLALFGQSDPYYVSFLVADKILSQSASVVALVAIMFATLRYLPELKTVVADLLYLVTGDEHEFDFGDPPGRGGVRADGGREE